MIVKEALEDYRYHITRLTEESQRWYIGKLTTFADWFDTQNIVLERLKAQDVGRFIDSLRTRVNPQTKKPLTSHALNSPDGTHYPHILDLPAFCRAHHLDFQQMYRLAQGEVDEAEGWSRLAN